MKAFSFSSILKNFGKQLSSLASQMPWCNLRFNLGSISVLSRVNPLFSRRVSHFAAILTILFTVGVGSVWGEDYTIALSSFTESPTGTYTKEGLDGLKCKDYTNIFVEVPSASASGTVSWKGSGSGERYLYIYKTNGTVKDETRKIVYAKSYGAVAFTSSDIKTSEGKYYLVFGTTDDWKAAGVKYTLAASTSCDWNINYITNGLKDGNASAVWSENNCFTQVGSTNEWVLEDFEMPDVAGQFWVGPGEFKAPSAWGHSVIADLSTIKWVYRSNKTRTEKSAVTNMTGTLNIWSDGGDDNYHIGIYPDYQITYGVDGSGGWTKVDFNHVSGTEYRTEIVTAPAGYKSNNNFKYYVGLRVKDNGNTYWGDKSKTVAMNGMSGMSSTDQAGKPGQWKIYEDSESDNYYCSWIPAYTLSYNANTGSGTMTPQSVASDAGSKNVTVLANGFTAPTGYQFDHWDTAADGSGTDYAPDATYNLTADATLYAIWTAVQYDVTLEKGSAPAAGSSGSAKVLYDATALTNISHATWTGHVLTGYYTSNSGGTKVLNADGTFAATNVSGYITDSKWTRADNTTVKAQWTCIDFTPARGGTADGTYTVGDDGGTLTCSVAAAGDYTYQWKQYTLGQGTGDAVNAVGTGATSTSFTPHPTAAGTYYYFCEVTNSCDVKKTTSTSGTFVFNEAVTLYTVTYNANGGSVTPTSATQASSGASVTLPTPTWSGYTFDGWYNAGTKIGNAGASYTPTADITLYAHWIDNISGKLFSYIEGLYGDKYKAFDLSGWVTGGGSGKDKTYTNGTTGVQFVVDDGAWDNKTNKTASAISSMVKFVENTTTASIVIPDGKTATVKILYGSYDKENKKLTVGGSAQNGPKANFDDAHTNAVLLSSDMREITLTDQTGTITLGSSSGNIYIARVSAVITSNATITATKTSPDYVSTDPNNLVLSISTTGASSGWYYRVKKVDGGYQNPDNTPYNTATWTMTSGLTLGANNFVVELYNGSDVKQAESATITVTAETAYPMNITAGTGGSVSPSGEIKANESGNHIHPEITATPNSGYHFVNWTKNNENATLADASSATTTITNATGACTITANFAADVVGHTVTYDAQGGSVTPTSETVSTATLPTPTKSGYTFQGWYTSGGELVSSPYSPTADITLHALWRSDECAGGGGGSTTLFNVNFKDETTEQIKASTDAASWVIKTYDSYSMSFGSKNDNSGIIDVINNTGLQFTGNNMNNYNCLAIPLSLTKDKEVTAVITLGDATQIKYNWVSGALPASPNNGSSGSNYGTNNKINTLTYTPTSTGNYVLYLGRSGSSSGKVVESIVITQAGGGSPTCYYVTYNGNGADGGYVNDANAYAANEEVTTLANSFTRAGYTFTGWNTAADGSGTSYAAGGTFTITENTELFAQWTENTPITPEPTTYTVTVNSTANGTVTADKTTGVAQGEKVTLTVTPASGYELETLTVKDASENDVNVTDNTFTMPASNVTVSATFTAIVTPGDLYTVTFDTNGGSEVSPITQASAGAKINLPTPTKDGYEFVGWYIGGELVTDDTYTPTADITATAAWKENCILGTGGEDNTTHSTTFVGSSSAIGNWSGSDLGSTDFKDETKALKLPTQKTLTYTFPTVVQLRSVKVVMAFTSADANLSWSLTAKDNNGNEIKSSTQSTTMGEKNVQETFNIPLEATNVKTVVLNNSSSKQMNVGEITFTIVISSGSGECYYVTYNGNGADGGYVNDANAYAANEEVTTLANGFTRAGYTFTGWNTAADGSTGTPYAAGGTFNITGNTELFAQWIENTNVELGDCTETTITYNLVTPNNSKPSQSATPEGVITELTGADAIGTATTNTGVINNSFADYSVRYGASDGSDNTNDGVIFTFTVPTGYVFKPSAITSNLMCYGKGKNGDTQNYEFYGTLSDGATTINGTALPGTADGANEDIAYSDIDKTLSGTVTLRLNAVKVGGSNQSFRIKSPITIVGELCSAQTYTITYDNNGGSGTMESTSNVVAENTFTREGYTFDGWNTAADGTGTLYAAGEIVASNLTLYAQWKCIEPEFTVSYEKTEYTQEETASELRVSVTAGNSGGVTYQWYSSTTNDRNNGNTIGGETSNSYTPSTESVGTTYYWCEIENTCTSVQTAMIAITVRAYKNTPSVTWNWYDAAETEKGTINYGGGNYTIAAQITSDGWNGTLTADMLTAPTGINLYNVRVQGNTISATFDVTTSFDRVANPTTIPFYLSLPETDAYYSLVSEGDVTYEACATSVGSGEIILEAAETNGETSYYFAADGIVITSIESTGAKNVSIDKNNKVKITVDAAHKEATITFTIGTGITITSFKTIGTSNSNTEYDLDGTTVTIGTALTDLNKTSSMVFKLSCTDASGSSNRNTEISSFVLSYTSSGGGEDVSLTWDTEDDLTKQVGKKQSDPNFTYTASLTGENSNTLGTITYSSSNPECAIVNPTTGEVEITATGTETLTTTITATLAQSGCYQGATATYTISVAGMECDISAGTLALTNGAENKCSGESVTLTLTDYTAAGTTLQWYKGDEAINGAKAATYTTTEPGAYSVLVTDNNNNLCAKRSNTITITDISAEASVTNIVNKWYIKNGRLTPEIALWKLEEGTTFESVTVSNGWADGTGFNSEAFSVKDGVVYLTGTPPKANETGEDKTYTLTLKVKDVCGDEHTIPTTITIIHQKNTDKHVLAFVVTGKEKGGFTEGIPAAQTTSVPLYNTISRNFEVLATNIYATDNEQLLKEYYSQFDIICITDYPDSKTTGVNGKSYTDAMGSLIDIRPILTMEAWVSKYSNWKNKGVTGDPKSPTTRQYSMLLQCKDHEIFAGTSLVSEDVDGETMYRVTMVDATKEDYVNLDKNTAGTDSYDHDGKPALQGFTYTSAMSSMLPIGIIDDGAGNNLQVGLERQHEIEARMMVIGVNSYAMERLTGDGEKVIINALNYLMKKNAEDISDCSIYFDNNGGTGDGLWSSPVNWGPSRNSLPQSSQEARILAPCVVSDYTAKVASVKIVTGGTYKYQSMDGEASGSLTIAPNGALVVKGRIQAATAPNYLEARNTDVKDLIVQSDATGNGALIHGEIGEAIGATVELLSKAYSVKEINPTTGKEKKKKYWQYVALPVQNALAEDAFWGAYTYQYDETQGWIKKGTGENIEEFWGIGLSIDNEVYSGANNEKSLTKFTIKGNLALATDRDIDLTRTTNAGEGQNMIGNSWTAPIHLTSMTEDDFENAVATVYIYNTGRDEQASGKEGTASSANGSTQAGQWISIPIAPTKLDPWQGPKVIPSMQAFEVDLVEGKTSGVLHLNYDKHVRTIATPEEENLPLRAPKYLGNEPSMIRLRVADSITYTDLYLIEGDQFTDEFDNAWDGKYQPCDGRSATLYAMSPIGDMAVLAQPSVNNTSVVFEPGKKSEYVFTFGYNGDVTYYLNDMQLKTSTEIKEGNEYRFTYNKGDMKNRFLVTRESFDSPNISTGLANIVTDGNGLQVTNPNQENLQVILIDAAGRMCSIYNTAEPMFKVELPATQGVYMINVKGETTNIVRKVVK